MSVCVFFGHKTAPEKIKVVLRSTIIDLIENKNVDSFYVGNNGAFDYMVKESLKSIKKDYPHIKYSVVLAYLPKEKDEFDCRDYSDTIYPEGLEKTPRRFAISKRNTWMVNRADFVITYVVHNFGGAAQFKALAERQNKIVINVCE